MTQTDPQKSRIAMRHWLLGAKYFMAAAAMEYGESFHPGLRKDGISPAFSHQIAIAQHIRTLRDVVDEEACLAIAFLHDTVEDGNASLAEIRSKFGGKVADATNLLSKNINGRRRNDVDYYAEIAQNQEASIVKGADRVNNVQTIGEVFTITKQREYIVETKTLVLPMLKTARRLFPIQEAAYLNIKFVLNSQLRLLENALAAGEGIEVANE